MLRIEIETDVPITSKEEFDVEVAHIEDMLRSFGYTDCAVVISVHEKLEDETDADTD